MSENYKKYVDLAVENGALNVVAIKPEEVVFDGRTILKCMFGCNSWGKGCTCPSRPGFLPLNEFKELFMMYKTVLVIHSTDKKAAQNASFAVEKEAYLDGDVLSFSTSDCAICEKCAGYDGEPCRNIKMARPSWHSIGIDVFATVNKLGLPLKPLRNETDEQNWYAAVWLN